MWCLREKLVWPPTILRLGAPLLLVVERQGCAAHQLAVVVRLPTTCQDGAHAQGPRRLLQAWGDQHRQLDLQALLQGNLPPNRTCLTSVKKEWGYFFVLEMPKACQSINFAPFHEYRYDCSLCQSIVSVSVNCVKSVMSEKQCFGTNNRWLKGNCVLKKTCTALIQILHTCFIPECDRRKLFQVSVVICMAGATIGIASQYFGDPIRW